MRLVACDESEYEVAVSWEELATAQQELFGTDEAITHETPNMRQPHVFFYTPLQALREAAAAVSGTTASLSEAADSAAAAAVGAAAAVDAPDGLEPPPPKKIERRGFASPGPLVSTPAGPPCARSMVPRW